MNQCLILPLKLQKYQCQTTIYTVVPVTKNGIHVYTVLSHKIT